MMNPRKQSRTWNFFNELSRYAGRKVVPSNVELDTTRLTHAACVLYVREKTETLSRLHLLHFAVSVGASHATEACKQRFYVNLLIPR